MKYLILSLFFILLSSSSFARKRVITPEEEKMIEKLKQQQIQLKKSKEKSNKKTVKTSTIPQKKKAPIYKPAPVVDAASNNGYVVDNDSTKIKTVSISHKDALTIKMCVSAGVMINLHNTFRDEFVRVLKDDDEFIDAEQMPGNRSVYVKLKQSVPNGKHWESAIRLVTKKYSHAYLVNIIGVACPQMGENPFPKVYYLKEKYGLLNANSDIMTPEDTIIEASEGYPRINKNIIRVYDMVASANSDWVLLGIEVQFRDPNADKTNLLFKMLDNHQINFINIKQSILEKQSIKATNSNGVPTLRFNVMVNINKDYILNSRYMHLMTIDKENNHYQYKRIDLWRYYSSLKNRGFKI